ncbi:hypothetical protein [Candidatus Desulfovibrio trichonymphae]|uniref:hypothetical protein n=1 Tax=Candidatus Desulfovibrio trichonymphae TaxID=1725232 RepID=UPI000BBA9673|nr:hypothetical protein [Candidatus Desulfovibrio trichonymphae]GHU97636.1 hypothetical protein AGMMS50248_02510 [Deltaproteobacteria bacterium]
MRFCVLFALCAMLCLSSAAFAAGLKASGGGISPKEAWNPKKNHHAENLTLRMPCGGQMVFRAVGVPAKDVLSDRRIKMGVREKPYPQREIYEHARDGYVSGPFTLKELPGKWRNALKQGKEIFFYYFMDKYAVSVWQWQAVMEGAEPIRRRAAGRNWQMLKQY